MELIGIPYRVVISERNLANDQLECRGRCDAEPVLVARRQLLEWLTARLTPARDA